MGPIFNILTCAKDTSRATKEIRQSTLGQSYRVRDGHFPDHSIQKGFQWPKSDRAAEE